MTNEVMPDTVANTPSSGDEPATVADAMLPSVRNGAEPEWMASAHEMLHAGGPVALILLGLSVIALAVVLVKLAQLGSRSSQDDVEWA